MKKFAVLLILFLICAMPVSARTCRNGKMTIYHNREITIYHNKNYGYYPTKHVWTDGSAGNKSDRKPVYSYSAVGKGPGAYPSGPRPGNNSASLNTTMQIR